ncbi:phospholipase D-like domain-containing protein [Vibrio parahaemolyticus]|nr:phospholipase D-like domain-containing protein [Vibrio parahaemolyticus]
MAVEAYFEDIEDEIIRVLRSSKNSVRICVAWISGKIYTPILDDLANRGVTVELVYDNNSTNLRHGVPFSKKYTTYAIDTRLSSSLMHNKFCIVDDEILITGSYNWSNKAKDSFENIVVIRNEFELIKDFLHEFYDLIAYYRAFSSNYVRKCRCGSNLFNLGILGQESGLYDESKIDVWSVCVKNNHVSHLGEEYEQHLRAQLGMKYEPDWRLGAYDKDSMLSEFQQERSSSISLQNYFNSRSGRRIHAIGTIAMDNWNGHMEWDEEPEYIVNIFWRDMYLRKLIPEALYDDCFGGINEIISGHV